MLFLAPLQNHSTDANSGSCCSIITLICNFTSTVLEAIHYVNKHSDLSSAPSLKPPSLTWFPKFQTLLYSLYLFPAACLLSHIIFVPLVYASTRFRDVPSLELRERKKVWPRKMSDSPPPLLTHFPPPRPDKRTDRETDIWTDGRMERP